MVQIMIEHCVMTQMRSYSALQDLAHAQLDILTLPKACLPSTANSALTTVPTATAQLLTIVTLAFTQMHHRMQARVLDNEMLGSMT